MATGNKKKYYSISEVCKITGLEPHILRYWESEFGQLRPKKNRAGNRAYRSKDIELIGTIKNLLYEEKFTIQGARKRLASSSGSNNGHNTHKESSGGTGVAAEMPGSPSDHGKNGNAVSRKELVSQLREVLQMLRS